MGERIDHEAKVEERKSKRGKLRGGGGRRRQARRKRRRETDKVEKERTKGKENTVRGGGQARGGGGGGWWRWCEGFPSTSVIESEARAKLYNIRAARRRGQIAVLAEHAGRFRFHYPSRIGRPSLDSCDARVNRVATVFRKNSQSDARKKGDTRVVA